ncbi:MAG: hypothetical protein KC646_08275 [Candidatus Cloacimonetes bacterium]|nr:hypothetical protein [Candidatus Cloacimonadota bacterium]
MNKYEDYIGLGVAGNFAGHLEQAGEASDFTKISVKDQKAPKGLFPFYVPSGKNRFIENYPISSTTIAIPTNHSEFLQVEPEVALICEIQYNFEHKVCAIIPTHFSSYNDCSIRKPGIRKISQKKNWGPNSKGLSKQWIPIDQFCLGGVMDSYRLASFIVRDNQIIEYGVDSPLLAYSYFYQTLLDWTVETINNQTDDGPLENISQLLEDANFPSKLILSIGATKYTSFGESNFLQDKDKVYIITYDSKILDDPKKLIDSHEVQNDHSVLKQIVK